MIRVVLGRGGDVGVLREGVERVSVNEQGMNTDDVRPCLLWSNQATGHSSSQLEEMKGILVWRRCGLMDNPLGAFL